MRPQRVTCIACDYVCVWLTFCAHALSVRARLVRRTLSTCIAYASLARKIAATGFAISLRGDFVSRGRSRECVYVIIW